MRRSVALLLLVSGLTLVGLPPAEAAPAVTLSPASQTVVEGDSARLTGRAEHIRLGSDVVLQQRTGSSWIAVKRKSLRTTRSFAFEVRPDLGQHRFRVVRPRQFGQPRAISPSVSVTVGWRPQLLTDAEGHLDPTADAWVTEVTGTAWGLEGQTIQVQRKLDGTWVSTDDSVEVGQDHFFRYTITGGAQGSAYRFYAPPEGLRLAAWSDPVVVSDEVTTPVLTLDAAAEITGASPAIHQQVRVSGTTSDPSAPLGVWGYDATERYGFPGGWRFLAAVSPAADGTFSQVITAVPDGTRLQLVAPGSDDGMRRPAMSEEVTVTLPHFTLDPDDPTLTVTGVAEDTGAILDVNATAGQLLSLDLDPVGAHSPVVRYLLVDPTGRTVWSGTTIERGTDEPYPSYVPRTTGTYRLELSVDPGELWPGNRQVAVTVTTPVLVDGQVDTSMTIGSTRPNQVVDIALTGSAGEGLRYLSSSAAGGFLLNDCSHATLLSDGPPIIVPFDSDPEPMPHLMRFPSDGDYTLRVWPCTEDGFSETVTLVSSSETNLELHREARVDLSRPDSFGLMRLQVSGDKVIELERLEESGTSDLVGVIHPSGESYRIWPFGDHTRWRFTPSVDGIYEIWIGPASSAGASELWTARVINN